MKWIFYILILAGFGLLIGLGSNYYSVISDNMIIYDEFNTLNYNKWNFSEEVWNNYNNPHGCVYSRDYCKDLPSLSSWYVRGNRDEEVLRQDEDGCTIWSIAKTKKGWACDYVDSCYYSVNCRDECGGDCRGCVIDYDPNSGAWAPVTIYDSSVGKQEWGGLVQERVGCFAPNQTVKKQGEIDPSVITTTVSEGLYMNQHTHGKSWVCNKNGYCGDWGYWGGIPKAVSVKEFATDDIKIKFRGFWYEGWSNPSDDRWVWKFDWSLKYGDLELRDIIPMENPAPSSEYDCRGYGHKTSCNEVLKKYSEGADARYADGVLEIKRYDDLDLNKFVVIWNGEELGTYTNSGDNKITFGGMIDVDYVKYEPYFSCEINPDVEVVVRDKFTAGSEVELEKLTYTPTKFCPQDLGVLIFAPQGVTDEKGSITQKIAEGETLTIPDDQYWQIDYVTKYVDDMRERCALGQAYDTETKQCIQIVQQQIDTTTLLYCEEDNDCMIPPQCPNTQALCLENKCSYISDECTQQQILNYIEVLRTLIIDEPEIERLNDGKIIVKFTQNNDLGAKEIMGTPFTSTISQPIINNPEHPEGEFCYVDWDDYLTKPECYKTKVNWGEYEYNMTDGDVIEINDYVTISYDFTGKGVYRGERGTLNPTEYHYEYVRENDWANTFTIEMNDIIEIKDVDYNEKYQLDDRAVLELFLHNNIISSMKGGYILQISKGMRDIRYEEKSDVQYGNLMYIDLPTDEVGTYEVELTPYTIVYDNIQYSLETLHFGYYVGLEEYGFDCRRDGCKIGQCEADGSCSIKLQKCTTDEECLAVDENLTCHEDGYCYQGVKNPFVGDKGCTLDSDCDMIVNGFCHKESGICYQKQLIEKPFTQVIIDWFYNFWQKFKWYIIGGIVTSIAIIGGIIYWRMKK